MSAGYAMYIQGTSTITGILLLTSCMWQIVGRSGSRLSRHVCRPAPIHLPLSPSAPLQPSNVASFSSSPSKSRSTSKKSSMSHDIASSAKQRASHVAQEHSPRFSRYSSGKIERFFWRNFLAHNYVAIRSRSVLIQIVCCRKLR